MEGLCGCSLAADADGGEVLELRERPGLRGAVAAEDETAHAAMVLPDDEREDEAARLAAARATAFSEPNQPRNDLQPGGKNPLAWYIYMLLAASGWRRGCD